MAAASAIAASIRAQAKPATGKLGILPGLESNVFRPSQLPFIDGTVIPNAAPQITSTGIMIQTRATDGQSWDYIQSGKVLSQDTAEIGRRGLRRGPLIR